MTESTWIDGGEWLATARDLRNDRWQLADLCGVDARDLGFDHRFEAVAQVVNYETKERRTIHVKADGDPPTVPSVTEVWPTANFMEREAYDLIGIVFDGHPNLTRILLPDEWEGHPLRKDYGVGKVAIEFVPQPFLQIDGPGQSTGTGESRQAVDNLGQVVPNGNESS
jgi:NADH:ubiquinone oxidoreductase subunit C